MSAMFAFFFIAAPVAHADEDDAQLEQRIARLMQTYRSVPAVAGELSHPLPAE